MHENIEPQVGDVWKTMVGEYQLVYQQKCESWLGVQEEKSGDCVSEWFGRNELTRLVERDGERVPGEAPKLVRRGINDWTDDGQPCHVRSNGFGKRPIPFIRIHAYVYDDPNDPESDIVTNRPSILWDHKKKSWCAYTTSKRIESGEVIRLLPVAVIVIVEE